MKFSSISAFVEVARSGSISEAARKLGRSRSQVSTWVSDLELDWGLELFDRSTYRPVLTEEGRRLLSHCKLLITEARYIEQLVCSLNNKDEGQLSVGIDCILPAGFRTELVASFYRQFPTVQFTIKQLTGIEIMNQLRIGDIQIGIGDCILPAKDIQFRIKEAGLCQFVVCCHPDYPLAALEEVSEIDLQSHRVILMTGLKERLDPRFFLEVPDYETVVALTRQGAGYCLCPLEYVKHDLDEGHLVIVNHISAVGRLQVGGYWNKEFLPNETGRFLLDKMSEIWATHISREAQHSSSGYQFL